MCVADEGHRTGVGGGCSVAISDRYSVEITGFTIVDGLLASVGCALDFFFDFFFSRNVRLERAIKKYVLREIRSRTATVVRDNPTTRAPESRSTGGESLPTVRPSV